MFQLNDVWDESKKIIGSCNDEHLLRQMSDAISLIANKLEIDSLTGFLDICTNGGKCVTLPREVETILAVNIGGKPTVGLSLLFSFHANGPGDCGTPCGWEWSDQGGWHSTYRDLLTPSKLVAYTSTSADNGKSLVVHGFDSAGNPLRRQVAGVWRSGWAVPTIYGYALPDSEAPLIARITGVEKDVTVGPVRLSTTDDGGPTGGVTLGVYEPDETLPQYRRIKLGRSCSWVRIAYRKVTPIFHSRYDRVPLKSRIAFISALRAIKFYHDIDLGLAHAFEADSARLELEAQDAAAPPTYFPVQVLDRNSLRDRGDYDVR